MIIKKILPAIVLLISIFKYGYAHDPAKGRLITIPEGINIVLKDNRLVKVSLLDKDIASANYLISRSALLPRVSGSVVQSYLNHQPGSIFGTQTINTGDKQSVSYGFDVYQTLFDFGKSLSAYKASEQLIGAAKENIEAVKRVAVLEFIIAYFDVLETQKMIAVADKQVQSLEAYLKDIRHLYEQGAAVKNDLLPAQVRLADAKQKLIAARNSNFASSARLKNILAFPLDQEIQVEDIEMKAPEFPGMEEAWKTAQSERAELKVIEDRVNASSYNEKSIQSGNLPNVYVDGGYKYAQNEYVSHQDNLFLNLGARADIFDGGATGAKLNRERAVKRQLLEQKARLADDIKLEIEDSFLALKNASEKVDVAKDALSQSEENVRVNRVRYAEGAGTTTEVLEAITLQTGAQTNFFNADYELKRGYARLLYSMGLDLALIYDNMKREKHER